MKLEDILPTDEDVAFYHEHGYYISRPIFTDAEIDAAVSGSERFYAGQLAACDHPVLRAYIEKWGPLGDYGHKLRKHDYASFFCRDLATITRSPSIGAIAARLSGSPVIRLWHDQLLYKPPSQPGDHTNVGWHTDRGYWKVCTSEQMLTAWVPFHDCDAQVGTVTMVDGSHRWPDNTEALDFFNNDLETLAQKFNTGGQPVCFVPMNLKKGQVSFHHCLTIHGSGPNLGQAPRRSIAVHLQDDANRYQQVLTPQGVLADHYNVRLARKGADLVDFSDPAVFPQLYMEDSARRP